MVWKTNSDWGNVMGVVHVLCNKVVNEVMCCCCADACMRACPHVKLSTQRNTVESFILRCPISPRLTSLTPYLLPSLISVTSLIHLRLTRPHLPHSLPFIPPNTPAQSEFIKVVGWFDNLIASIRIKFGFIKTIQYLMLWIDISGTAQLSRRLARGQKGHI
jgi:hypothetical protein